MVLLLALLGLREQEEEEECVCFFPVAAIRKAPEGRGVCLVVEKNRLGFRRRKGGKEGGDCGRSSSWIQIGMAETIAAYFLALLRSSIPPCTRI